MARAVAARLPVPGPFYPWQSKPRGAPALDRPPHEFISFLENHDQVANAAIGRRLIDISSQPAWRAMSALLLLGPWTPLLFQGEEWGSRKPFGYFSDHGPDLQRRIFEGRRSFLSQFTRLSSAFDGATTDAIGRPLFDQCHLEHEAEPEKNPTWRLFRDLAAMRRSDGALGQHYARLSGATLTTASSSCASSAGWHTRIGCSS